MSIKKYGWGEKSNTITQTRKLARKSYEDNINEFIQFPIKDSKKRLMGYEIARKLYGKDIAHSRQHYQDCVSFGCKHAVQYLQVYEIAIKNDNETYKPLFAPYFYGTSRKTYGFRTKGAGSYGSSMATAVKKYGSIQEDVEGLPKYSESVAYDWSGPDRDGTWDFDKWTNIGKKFLVQQTARITTWEEAVAAICNGYFVTIASNYGFHMLPNSKGFHVRNPRDPWPHQMCHPPQTLITTGLTTKDIVDIEVGELVYSNDGELHKVTEKYERTYEGVIYEIKCYGTHVIKVTPEHPLLVKQEVWDDSGPIIVKTKKQVWKLAKNLKIGDELISPILKVKKEPIPSFSYRKNCKNIPDNLYIDKDIAWFIGLFVADGYAKKNHRLSIKLDKNQMDYAKRAKKALEKINIKGIIKQQKNCIEVIGYSAILASAFAEWFGKKTNKNLPKWVYNFDIKEVIDGVFCGDGCKIRGKRKCIVNTSYKLVYELYNMLNVLNLNPGIDKHIYDKNKYPNWNDKYTLTWSIDGEMKTTTRDDTAIYRPIYKIDTSYYKGKVFNFEVIDSHNYIANSIVSHNCGFGIDDPFCCIFATVATSFV